MCARVAVILDDVSVKVRHDDMTVAGQGADSDVETARQFVSSKQGIVQF